MLLLDSLTQFILQLPNVKAPHIIALQITDLLIREHNLLIQIYLVSLLCYCFCAIVVYICFDLTSTSTLWRNPAFVLVETQLTTSSSRSESCASTWDSSNSGLLVVMRISNLSTTRFIDTDSWNLLLLPSELWIFFPQEEEEELCNFLRLSLRVLSSWIFSCFWFI